MGIRRGIRPISSAVILGLVALSFSACTNRASRLLSGGTTPFNFTPSNTPPDQPIIVNNNGFSCTVPALQIPRDFKGVARMLDSTTNQYVNGLVFEFTISTTVASAVVINVESMPPNFIESQSGNFKRVFFKHQMPPGTKFRVSYKLKKSSTSTDETACASPEIDYRALYTQLRQLYPDIPNLDSPGSSTGNLPVFTPANWPPWNPGETFGLTGVPVKIKILGPDRGVTLNCISLEVALFDVADQRANARSEVRIGMSELNPQGQEINTLSVFVKTAEACANITQGGGTPQSNAEGVLTGDLIIPQGQQAARLWYIGINAHTATLVARHRNNVLQEGRKTLVIENNEAQTQDIYVNWEDCFGCDRDYNDGSLHFRGLLGYAGSGMFVALRNETIVVTPADTTSTSGCTHELEVLYWRREANGALTYVGRVLHVPNDHAVQQTQSFAVTMGSQFTARMRSTNGCSETSSWQDPESQYTRVEHEFRGLSVEGAGNGSHVNVLQ